MLTETDIHYLVGLLSLIASPEDVQIELGSMIYDDAAKKVRDVDITITSVDSKGIVTAFKGIEVKKHRRPLDSTHVEQLAAKLNDMKSITHKSIVSASGYTKSAINKARYHGVDLYLITNWENTSEGFDHFGGYLFKYMHERSLELISGPFIEFNPGDKISKNDIEKLKNDPEIFSDAGGKGAEFTNLSHLIENIMTVTKKKVEDLYPQPFMIDENETKPFSITIDILDKPYFIATSGKLVLRQARVSGIVKWIEKKQELQFKILKKLDDVKPFAGCAITEISNGNLIGITVSNTKRNIELINIPISDRNKRKILKYRLKQRKD